MEKTNILKLFFILNVSLVFCYNRSDLSQKTEELLERKKRQDDCGNSAKSAIAENSFKLASSLGKSISNPSNVLALGETISSLTSSIYGFKTPTICDISVKLDEVILELSIIKNKIEGLAHDIECSRNKQYVQDIKNLVFRFKIFIETHKKFMDDIKGKDNNFVRKSKVENLNKILNLCYDNSQGIGKVLSEFQRIFFNHNEMKYLFRDCCKYQRKKVDNLIETFKLIYIQMVTSIRFCSEAEYGSNIIYDLFPYKQFEKDVNNHIEYYLEYLLPSEFAKDTNEVGMERAIKNIAKQYTLAEDAKNVLTKTFSNYYWTVIYYPESVKGSDNHWFYACVIQADNNIDDRISAISEAIYASGSIMFMRSLKNSKNALIAWQLKSSYVTGRNNQDIDLTYKYNGNNYGSSWKAKAHTEYKWSRNKNLNFLLTINSYSFTLSSGLHKYFTKTYIEGGGYPSHTFSMGPPEYTHHIRSFAKYHAIVKKLDKPKISKLYDFHTTKDNPNYQKFEKTRFTGHYKYIFDLSLNECWLKCNQDEKKCNAITFDLPSNCRLYESKNPLRSGDDKNRYTSIIRI